MSTLARFSINWSGAGVNGKAQSHLHFLLDGNGLPLEVINPIAAGLRNVLDGDFAAYLPGAVQVAVDPEVLAIDVPTGQILLAATLTQGTNPVQGTDASPFSAASGAVMSFSTGDIVAGRRVKGRWFLVPLGGSAYDGSGTLAPAFITHLLSAGAGIVGLAGSGTPLVVYSRPRTGAGARSGSTHVVTSASTKDKVAILRSRRD